MNGECGIVNCCLRAGVLRSTNAEFQFLVREKPELFHHLPFTIASPSSLTLRHYSFHA